MRYVSEKWRDNFKYPDDSSMIQLNDRCLLFNKPGVHGRVIGYKRAIITSITSINQLQYPLPTC
jgi:hypothetical protein